MKNLWIPKKSPSQKGSAWEPSCWTGEFNCHDQLSAQTAASGGLTASHLAVPHETALLGVTHSSRIRFSPAQILHNSREKVSKYEEIFAFYQVFRIIRGFFICCCCGLSHTSLKNFSTQHPASVNGRDERQAAMDRSGGWRAFNAIFLWLFHCLIGSKLLKISLDIFAALI